MGVNFCMESNFVFEATPINWRIIRIDFRSSCLLMTDDNFMPQTKISSLMPGSDGIFSGMHRSVPWWVVVLSSIWNALPLWCLPSSLKYKMHLSKQLNCWSLGCSWGIACRRCSNYIFILGLTPGLNILCKDNCKLRRRQLSFGIQCGSY